MRFRNLAGTLLVTVLLFPQLGHAPTRHFKSGADIGHSGRVLGCLPSSLLSSPFPEAEAGKLTRFPSTLASRTCLSPDSASPS